MIHEIRNYHYNPEKLELYRQWAINEAVPFLKQELDVVGFWIDSGDSPEYSGDKIMQLPLGTANVTWIIRWDSMEDRKAGHKRVFGGDGWKEVFKKHPDANGYFQIEAKFANAV
ncbi:MAG: NIPSNAP family protein [Pseudomonadales bacterium]|nr:NIPSNAP family protein [Pseudomonadales bacterium]